MHRVAMIDDLLERGRRSGVFRAVGTGQDTLTFSESGENDGLGTLLDRVQLYRP